MTTPKYCAHSKLVSMRGYHTAHWKRGYILLSIMSTLFIHFKTSALCRTDYSVGGNAPRSAAYSPDGLNLAVANSNSGDISVFRVGIGGELTSVQGSPFDSGTASSSLAYSPDGSFLAVTFYGNGPNSGGGVSVFNVGTGGVLTPVQDSPFSTSNPQAIAYSPDGSTIAVTLYGSATVEVYGVGAEGVLTSVDSATTGSQPTSATYSPDGSYLVVVGYELNRLSIFNVGTGGVLSEVSGSPFSMGSGTHPTDAAYSPDGSYLAITNGGSKNVSVFKVGPGGTLTPVPGSPFYAAGSYPTGGIGLTSAAYSPDGLNLAVANRNSDNISVFSVGANGTLTPISGSPFTTGGNPRSVAYSPDGAYIVTANSDSNSVSIFTVACSTGSRSAQLNGLLSGILHVYFLAKNLMSL